MLPLAVNYANYGQKTSEAEAGETRPEIPTSPDRQLGSSTHCATRTSRSVSRAIRRRNRHVRTHHQFLGNGTPSARPFSQKVSDRTISRTRINILRIALTVYRSLCNLYSVIVVQVQQRG
jgi:hypothetical protein